MDTAVPEVKKPIYKKVWFWILMVVLLISIVSGDSTTQAPSANENNIQTEVVAKKEISEVVIEVQATKLIEDYKANEIAADATYKDKLIKVTGVVGSIAKDILDNPYVTLTNETEYGFESVQCLFSKADEANLTNVEKDTRITLQGRVSGKSLTNVLVEECVIIN